MGRGSGTQSRHRDPLRSSSPPRASHRSSSGRGRKRARSPSVSSSDKSFDAEKSASSDSDSSTSPSPSPERRKSHSSKKRNKDRSKKRRKAKSSKTKESSSKEPTTEEAYLINKGRMAGRYISMWGRFGSMIEHGIVRDANPDKDEYEYLPSQNQKYQYYLALIELAPHVPDLAGEMGLGSSILVDKWLDKGRSAARSSDINSLKGAVINWRSFSPSLQRKFRHMWGFNNDGVAVLLCPSSMDIYDTATRAGLRNGTITAKPTDFPLFMFAHEWINHANLLDGWLKGEFLVLGWLHIFVAPSAAASDGKTCKSNQRGNAAQHDIRTVSFPGIAYVATLLRFVLSSQGTFSAGGKKDGPGQWPHRDFYNAILNTVETLMSEEQREELVAWWNEKVFGDAVPNYEEDSDGEDTSMFAQMKAQVVAQREAERKAEEEREAEKKAAEQREAAKQTGATGTGLSGNGDGAQARAGSILDGENIPPRPAAAPVASAASSGGPGPLDNSTNTSH